MMSGSALDHITLGNVKLFRDERGALGVLDFVTDLPFVPVRMFWIHDVPEGGERGAHAHKACTQYILCGQGRIDITAFDGVRSSEFNLEAGDYLNVVPGIFVTLKFTVPSTMAIVMCDRPYEADDYIYDASLLSASAVEPD